MPGQPHDKLVRAILRRPGTAAAVLEALLPEAVREHLDLRNLRRVPESFIDSRLRETVTDLLFETTFAGVPALVHVLLEHLSRPRPMAPYEMDRAMRRIWEEWRGRNPGASLLPPVIPVVLFHGERPWSGARRLRDLIDVPPEAREALAPWLPDQAFILVDLTMIPDEALRRIAMRGAALAALSLLFLRHSHDGMLLDNFVRSAELAREVVRAPDGWSALAKLVRYVLMNTGISDQDLGRTLDRVLGPKAKDITMTTAERLRREGRAEALTEGLTKGRTEGLIEARREDLLRVLQARFGAPIGEYRSRVLAAGLGTLDVWFDRALTAADLHSVFTD